MVALGAQKRGPGALHGGIGTTTFEIQIRGYPLEMASGCASASENAVPSSAGLAITPITDTAQSRANRHRRDQSEVHGFAEVHLVMSGKAPVSHGSSLLETYDRELQPRRLWLSLTRRTPPKSGAHARGDGATQDSREFHGVLGRVNPCGSR